MIMMIVAYQDNFPGTITTGILFRVMVMGKCRVRIGVG